MVSQSRLGVFHCITLLADRSEGVFRRRREDSGLSRRGTATSSSEEEEEEEDRGGVDDKGDRHECGDGLSTPCTKVRPAFSRSQTPCEGVRSFVLFVGCCLCAWKRGGGGVVCWQPD